MNASIARLISPALELAHARGELLACFHVEGAASRYPDEAGGWRTATAAEIRSAAPGVVLVVDDHGVGPAAFPPRAFAQLFSAYAVGVVIAPDPDTLELARLDAAAKALGEQLHERPELVAVVVVTRGALAAAAWQAALATLLDQAATTAAPASLAMVN